MIFNKYDWKKIKIGNITIYYLSTLDGGGSTFGLDFVPVVKETFEKVNKVCEFGCGPGFIGFSLLAHGLCKKLVLTDINPLAIKACTKTIKENCLEGRVSTFISDVLDDIPKNEKWDLVVSNPPHFLGTRNEYKKNLILIDPDWQIHKKFYRDVSRHLTENGSILFVENLEGSQPKMWENMIIKNKLKFIKIFKYKPSLCKKISSAFKLLYSLYGINIFNILSFLITNRKKLPPRLKNRNYPFYFVWSKRN